MLKLLATWWARRKYLFNEYVEAETNDIKARVVESRITEMKADAAQLVVEAEEIEENIKREEATPEYQALVGQEKYEADKEKREAEKIVDNKRQTAKQAEEAATQMTETVKHFRRMAIASRETAERVRNL
jgi:citrate synthase